MQESHPKELRTMVSTIEHSLRLDMNIAGVWQAT